MYDPYTEARIHELRLAERQRVHATRTTELEWRHAGEFGAGHRKWAHWWPNVRRRAANAGGGTGEPRRVATDAH